MYSLHPTETREEKDGLIHLIAFQDLLHPILTNLAGHPAKLWLMPRSLPCIHPSLGWQLFMRITA
jgi:hypothetical protein